jgi:ABC-2 type transport system permease protein
MEIKKILFYRGDLLVRITWAAVVRVVLGYYLWRAIFEARGVSVIQGQTFDQIVLYYVIAALAANAVLFPVGLITREVYEGSLTKYLLYPIPYLLFRTGAALANCCVGVLQLCVGVAVWYVTWGSSGFESMSLMSVGLGIITVFVASILYFCMAGAIELLSLWVEQAQSLALMVLFLVNLLGGIFIPISMFPAWAQTWLSYSPFPYLVFFPAEIFRGSVGLAHVFLGWLVMSVWIAVFASGGQLLWKRGSYQYSGVGM